MTKKPRLLNSINDVRLIKLTYHSEENGVLVAMEGLNNIPFSIARVFVVKAPTDEVRGKHAHRECAQFMTCSNGVIEVLCDDGDSVAKYCLGKPNEGLFIPPSIWAEEIYKKSDSVLTVLCDRPYEADDYIRDYEEFRIFRKNEVL